MQQQRLHGGSGCDGGGDGHDGSGGAGKAVVERTGGGMVVAMVAVRHRGAGVAGGAGGGVVAQVMAQVAAQVAA